MTVPIPPLTDRPAGTRLTSDMYRQDVTTTATFLTKPPVFLSVQTAAQSIGNTTVTSIAMNSTVVDSYNGHSDTVNNTRYAPPIAGWYLLIGSVSFAVNATGNRLCEFRKNGSGATLALGQGAMPTTDIGNNPTPRTMTIAQFNGTSDYVELVAFQSSGGALNTVPSQSGFAAIWMHA
ncbi:hypothetical protein ACGF0D_10795 [Kitasatospora sp. NPDC048298]|uniref:hypothetical protein n=1 Tax=Kitasatospora sp. NPDC048298 TaxID=3364049 RepID=UPI0037127A66